MLLNATLWLTVTHTFKSNEPKLADWSKLICITLRRYFCGFLTSNREVSTGRSFLCFIKFAQITKNVVISSYIKHIETNLAIGKHIMRVIT